MTDLEFAKYLYFRFATIYGERFTRNHPTDEYMKMWWQDWAEGLAGIDRSYIPAAINHCKLNLEWAPSLAEFRRICEHTMGLPTVAEAFQAAILRDFSHPITESVFARIGSWEMSHGTEKDLLPKFKEFYDEEIAKMRLKSQQEALKLENPKLRIVDKS